MQKSKCLYGRHLSALENVWKCLPRHGVLYKSFADTKSNYLKTKSICIANDF